MMESLFIMLVLIGIFLWVLTFALTFTHKREWAELLIVSILTIVIWLAILANTHYIQVSGVTAAYNMSQSFGPVCYFFIFTPIAFVFYGLIYFFRQDSEKYGLQERDAAQKAFILNRRRRGLE